VAATGTLAFRQQGFEGAVSRAPPASGARLVQQHAEVLAHPISQVFGAAGATGTAKARSIRKAKTRLTAADCRTRPPCYTFRSP